MMQDILDNVDDRRSIVHILVLGDDLTEKVGEGNGTPLQYSCLENPMGRRAWQAAVHGVAKSWARLNFTFAFHFHALEKEMATHSSVLAWRILETVGPRLWGCTESDMTEGTQQQQQGLVSQGAGFLYLTTDIFDQMICFIMGGWACVSQDVQQHPWPLMDGSGISHSSDCDN